MGNLLLLNKDVVLSIVCSLLFFFLLVLTRFFLKIGKSSLKWRSCSDGWTSDKLLDADSFVGNMLAWMASNREEAKSPSRVGENCVVEIFMLVVEASDTMRHLRHLSFFFLIEMLSLFDSFT